MKNKINLSYNKNKLKRLPTLNGSNINLSINNTFVLIKNQTPDNNSNIKKNILPNIFTYNTKKKENIFSPIKKSKKAPNIKTFNLMRSNTVISEQKYPEDFILTTKLLNRMLWFFNIRELLILMNVNRKINNYIKNTPIFKKYIQIRTDFKNGNFFSNSNNKKSIINIKNSILKKSNNNIKIQINKESCNFPFNKNDTNNKNINLFLQYNFLNKKKIKLKKFLNPDISTSFSKLSLNSSINNIQNNINVKNEKEFLNTQFKNIYKNKYINNEIDSFSNSVLSSSKTGVTKNENKENENLSKNDIKSNISTNSILNYNKLKLNFLSLIKNNGNKISVMMRKYKLTDIEAKMILNGIIEFILLRKQKYENEKNNKTNFFSSLILQNIKSDKYFIYYIDPILNLEFEDIIKIHFDNIIISSINIMKKICNLLSRNFTSIKILLLQNNNINDKCAKILFQALKFNKALTILNLDHNKISIGSIIYSDLFFKYNISLNTLVLSYNYLGYKGSNFVLNCLKSNKKSVLRTLDLSYNGISHEGIKCLAEYIKSYGNLLSLFFSGNCIEDKGLGLFVKLLFNQENDTLNNIKLSYLDINNNYFTKNSCKYVCNIISLSSFITSINISNNKFYNEGINNIFSSINIKSKLVSLDLSQTFINEKCIEFISEKIDKKIILRILNLSYNNLGKACIYLKNLLIKETNIKVLKLKECKISENINLIFQGLCKNTNLETFDLSCNNININNIILNDILLFFKENKKLMNLILDNNNIDDIGIKFISQGIELNNGIKKISLKNNFITDESIESLINSVKNNQIIRKIEIEGNGISKIKKEKLCLFLSNKLNKK